MEEGGGGSTMENNYENWLEKFPCVMTGIVKQSLFYWRLNPDQTNLSLELVKNLHVPKC